MKPFTAAWWLVFGGGLWVGSFLFGMVSPMPLLANILITTGVSTGLTIGNTLLYTWRQNRR